MSKMKDLLEEMEKIIDDHVFYEDLENDAEVIRKLIEMQKRFISECYICSRNNIKEVKHEKKESIGKTLPTYK